MSDLERINRALSECRELVAYYTGVEADLVDTWSREDRDHFYEERRELFERIERLEMRRVALKAVR